MIPKIIHYCWLSNDPVPEHLEKCMESWKRVLKGYEFIKWDFNRFDKESSRWVSQAFDNKKYAFAADYIRLYALYNYGGIYMDMDVEVLRPFDDLLNANQLICYEADHDLFEMATIGAPKGSAWVKDILSYYDNRSFIMPNGEFDTLTLPCVAHKSLDGKYHINDTYNGDTIKPHLTVYPSDYFSPKSYSTGKLFLTKNTYSIHHFEGSWLSDEARYNLDIQKKLQFLPNLISSKLASVITSLKFKGVQETLKLIFRKIFE